MSDIKIVFGVKIYLTDHADPVTANSNIGLYNVNSDMAANANSGQKDVTVDDGTEFEAGQVVTVKDDNASETAYINSIAGNVLTMYANLTNSYTTAANGIVNGNSVFGWIQNDISGLSGNWKSGMLVKDGIKKWTRGIDLKRGGNTAQSYSSGCSIKNTSLFWYTIEDLEIFINGLRSEIYEFQDTTPTRVYSGKCEKPTWDTTKYNINFKGFHASRITNITKKINIPDYPEASGDLLDKPIPATYGEIRPVFDENDNVAYNGYVKFVRTADKIETFEIGDVNTVGDYELRGDPTPLQTFPVVGNDGESPSKVYKMKIGLTGVQWYLGGTTLLTSGSYPLDFFEDYYIHVVEGEQDDKYRKISDAYVDIDDDPTLIVATVNDYFERNLAGNSLATAEDNSWVTLDDINRDYQVDTWPCKGYISNIGVTLSSNAELYAYDSSRSSKFDVSGEEETIKTNVDETPLQFLRLPEYAYEDSGNGDNNILNIDVKLFDGTPDQMNSFLILPVENPTLSIEANSLFWAKWGIGAASYVKKSDGLYGDPFASYTITPVGNLSSTIDKEYNTSYQTTVASSDTWAFAILCNLPSFPKNFQFDNMYFGLRVISNITRTPGIPSVYYDVKWRRFIGTSDTVLSHGAAPVSPGVSTVENIADQHYLTNPNTSNLGLYSNGQFIVSVNDIRYYGYYNSTFLGIDNEKLYNSIQELLVSFRPGGNNETHIYNIYELAVIFRKSISIKKALYSPFLGRIFNDTWETRKTSTDLIESPKDLLEHLDRLQYYDDSPPPANGWGLGYAIGAKIKTGATANGSFDNTDDGNLIVLSGYKAANQPQKFEECYTDKLKKSLCRNFHLASWVDKNGYECVKRIVNAETSPSDTVTLSDIIDRKRISVDVRPPMDIYPEPFIRYRKNFANGEYESIIRIINVDQESYQAGYVEGIEDSTEAEVLWGKCQTLFKKTKNLNKPPSDLTDSQWFNGTDAYERAKEYLENWINWMYNPTCKINVHYNKAGQWEEAHRFILQLPHQTNNVQIECILTKITIDPNSPYICDVEAIMLAEDIPEEYYIKDTWTNFGDDNDWKDTYTIQGGDDDIKDSM